ncbi:hypothetical protein T484DRAFT_2353036 [Baffinella frigidus]|nr:hypothetical protein T484DRAFT_2353036 [Cryptophyta sp. CCMP2293]
MDSKRVAYCDVDGRLFVTGKLWNKFYEIEVTPLSHLGVIIVIIPSSRAIWAHRFGEPGLFLARKFHPKMENFTLEMARNVF